MGLEDEFTDIVKKSRNGQSLSIDDLAKKSGLHPGELSELEAGTRRASNDEVEAIARSLGIRPGPLGEIAREEWNPQAIPASLREVHTIVGDIGGYEVKGYILFDPDAKEALIIDTGYNASAVLSFLDQQGLKLKGICLTHGHTDHAGGLEQILATWKVPVYLGQEDISLAPWLPSRDLLVDPEEGATLHAGRYSVTCLVTPGHTPGGICYQVKAASQDVCFVGDTLFAGSIGRANPLTLYQTHLESVRKRVLQLPRTTILMPGHGPATTVVEEIQHNPFASSNLQLKACRERPVEDQSKPPYQESEDSLKADSLPDTFSSFEQQSIMDVESEEVAQVSSSRLIPLGLFLLTVFTTLWAGAYQTKSNPNLGAWDYLMHHPTELWKGIPFSATLLGILVTHEFGHYFFSRVHRVPATLPLFIPGLPHVIGTFGAIIKMKGPILSRRALFDIGVAGPIAGFIVAVGALIIGLGQSTLIARWEVQPTGPFLGSSVLISFFVSFFFEQIPPGYVLNFHPIADAAWFGLFITSLNLIPIGQFDGGHVAYALWGDRQRTIALTMVPILLFLGWFGWPGWFLWAGLAGLMGLAHPPVVDPDAPLGLRRIWIGWGALVIFIITFSPVPFSIR